MIKKIFIFCLLFLLGVVFIVVLYSYSTRDKKVKNGFERNFSKKEVEFKGQISLEDELYSITDVTRDSIVLYKFLKPYEFLKIPINFNRFFNVKITSLSVKEKFEGMNTMAFIKDSILVLSGKTSMAYKINSGHKILAEKKLDSMPFYQSAVINSNSFVFISDFIFSNSKRRKLKKVNWEGKEINQYIPERQIDGYFCTDGFFTYDKESNKLVYAFYYRGTFTSLDTNLNVLYQANTIDTVKHAKIYLRNVDDKITQTTPPHIVSKRLCIANNKIYLQSAIKADNEKSDDFDNSEVIDIYNLDNGKYTVSFYLPKIKRQKLTAFKIYKDTFVGLFNNNTLAVFKLPDF